MNKLVALAAAAALIVISGCKVVINTGANGYVTTQSGAYNCARNSKCEIDVVDAYFNEEFVAVPNNGYRFKEWRKYPRSFCGADTKPCHLTTVGFGVYQELMAFLQTDERFYLEPVFEAAPPTLPSNPYAKYNGVWQVTIYAGTLRCSNGNTAATPTLGGKSRISVASNGQIAETIIESPPVPAGYRVIETRVYENLITADGGYRALSDSYAYTYDAGYYTTQTDVRGSFSDSSHMNGTALVRGIYHDFGVECSGNLRTTMTKISN